MRFESKNKDVLSRCRSRGGGGGRVSGPLMKNHKNVGFPSNTGPDPLKNHKWHFAGRLYPSHTHTYGLLRRVSDQTAVVRRKMRAGPNFLMRFQDAITYSCG